MAQNKQIKLAIVGVGNCAASLLQGLEYYRQNKHKDNHPGLLHYDIGGYAPKDIEIVAAFDIDKRKVGKRIDQAIEAPPNCVFPIKESIGEKNIKVSMGHILRKPAGKGRFSYFRMWRGQHVTKNRRRPC